LGEPDTWKKHWVMTRLRSPVWWTDKTPKSPRRKQVQCKYLNERRKSFLSAYLIQN
jgi:hypothetical protein